MKQVLKEHLGFKSTRSKFQGREEKIFPLHINNVHIQKYSCFQLAPTFFFPALSFTRHIGRTDDQPGIKTVELLYGQNVTGSCRPNYALKVSTSDLKCFAKTRQGILHIYHLCSVVLEGRDLVSRITNLSPSIENKKVNGNTLQFGQFWSRSPESYICLYEDVDIYLSSARQGKKKSSLVSF